MYRPPQTPTGPWIANAFHGPTFLIRYNAPVTKKIPAALWFGLLPVLLGLPFIGRAYFVDDHYHLLMARGLLEHPTRPYDFLADDAGVDNVGWERGQPPRMVNPPLHHYLLALFWKITGGRLWAVRLLALFVSGAAIVFLYLLAQRFAVPPGPAAALAALTPAFWLSSYALLIDSTMLVFFLGGLWGWFEGLRRRSAGWLMFAGTFMGLAIVTKYTAATVVPLAGLLWWFDRESGRRPLRLAALAIPFLVLGLWSFWNLATYGAVHLTESSKRVIQSFAWSHILVFLAFFSGVFLLPLGAWSGVLRSQKSRLWVLLSATALAWFLSSPFGGFSPFQALFMAAFIVGGAAFFVESGRAALLSRYPLDRFLWLWLLAASVQMIYVMQWVAARYFLTLLPPVIFLSLRRWEETMKLFPQRRGRRLAGWLAALTVAGGSLGLADYLQAETGRWIIRDVTAAGWLGHGRTGYFLGDSFTGSDLKDAGWKPAFESTVFRPGDLLLRSEVIMPRWWFRPRSMRPLVRYEYSSRFPLRVMDNLGAAGFYASAWGALPYTLSREPLDRYTLFEVVSATGPTEAPPSRPGA